MASFSSEIINGRAFDKDEYSVESMMQLEAKLSQFYLYFHAIDGAQIKEDGKWVPACVYISGTHRYLRYRKLKNGEKQESALQTFYQFPDSEYTTVDFATRPFRIETNAAARTLSIDGFEILCPKSRDFNIVVFSTQVADRFLQLKKPLFTPRSVDGLTPYVYDDHAKRMGLPMDENRLISFPLGTVGFNVLDEFSDILEQGIMKNSDVRLQKRAANGRIVPATLGILKNQSEGCEVTMAAFSNGFITSYKYMGLDTIPMKAPLLFYLDPNARLYGNAEQKKLLYTFSAYGRRGIELSFTTEAEYYSMGNLLYLVIRALGGSPSAEGSGGALSGTLADVEAATRQKEPEVSPMEELNALVGLDSLKNDVQELISLVRMQKMREEKGMRAVPVTLHLVFTGNPGTGKTTVARILGKLYKEIGVLSKGQLIECDRSGLVAGYIGHTAIQTQKKIDEAMGGILFIDEAYTLAKEGNDFGQEAIDTLLKGMEDHRKDFVVIVAGYPDLMQKFINSNPGLKSRFNKYMNFPDYSAEELIRIFDSNCSKYQYTLEEDARAAVEKKIQKMVDEKDDNFANAREIRNLFETIITNQASRVDKIEEITDEVMVTITLADVEAE